MPLRERAGHSNFAPQQSFKTRTSVLPVRADRLNLVYLIGTSAKLVSRVRPPATGSSCGVETWADWKPSLEKVARL